MEVLVGSLDFNIVDSTSKLLDALNRLDAQRLRKVLSKRDERGYTLLHVATERNQSESLKCLIIKNVDPNTKSTAASDEVTPLHVAARCGNLACLQLLVQSGADVTVCDVNNLTPSDYAIRAGQTFCLSFLQEKVARKEEQERPIITRVLCGVEQALKSPDHIDLNSLPRFDDIFQPAADCPPDDGDIMRRRCSILNSAEIVKIFSTISRDVPTALHNASILHVACYYGNLELVRLLLEHYPCAMYLETSEGYNSLHVATACRQVQIVEALILANISAKYSKLKVATKDGVIPDEEPCLHGNLGVNTRSGHSALHFAVTNNDMGIVMELVKHHKELNLPIDCNGCGYTPLHMAVFLRHQQLVGLLLHKGADPNLRLDKAMTDHLHIGPTPLAEAVLGGSREIMQLLLEHRAEDRQHDALRLCFKSGMQSSMIPLLLGTLIKTDEMIAKEVRRKVARVRPASVDWSNLQLKALEPKWLNEGIMQSQFFRIQSAALKNTLEFVTTLNISSNQLTSLPWVVFSQLPMLSVLNASSNDIRSFPEPDPNSGGEGTGEHITKLDFSKNQLAFVPHYIFQLPKLMTLDLSDNKLTSLPLTLWSCPKLHNFNCSKNLLESIPAPECNQAVLDTPAVATSPTPQKPMMKKPVLSETQIPRYLRTDKDTFFTNRESPVVETVPISKLEDRLNICNGNLPIDWEHNKDKEEIYDGLSILNLSHNQIKFIPDCLPCLSPKLTRLDLSYNCIERVSIPKSFPTGLKQLTLSFNPIAQLDSEKCVPKPLPCLSSQLSQETAVEEGSFCQHRKHNHLVNLTVLEVSNCQLNHVSLYSHAKGRTGDEQSLLAAIANTQAHKNYRNLEAFARLVCPLLTRLVLAHNMLEKVPASICDMTTLNSLDLSHNGIIELPAALGKLSNLWEFPLEGLKLISPPHNIIERGKTKDIIGFLWSLLQRARPYHRMKLMFVGKAAMGKTSLLEKISEKGQRGLQENWALTRMMAREGVRKEKLSTVGIVVSDWTYYKKVPETQTALKSITFMTWDFGGQEEYYATHQCFISRRALYIVVWNMALGFAGVHDLKPWLLNIQARAPHSPVIIVGTHLDELNRAQRRSLPEFRHFIETMYGSSTHPKEGFPQIMGIEEISSKTSKNIDRLRQLIFDVASMVKENTVSGRGLGCGRIPEYRLLMDQLVPASYLQLEDTVRNIALVMRAQRKPPVLTYKELRERVFADPSTLISKNSEDRELEQAVRFLHDNGTMLHYEDPILSNFYFVDPQWLVDMLAHVVTVREINPLIKDGIMRTADLAHLFNEEEFPIQWKKEYIRLLTTFEVAVQLGETELLIPSALPEQKPRLLQPQMPTGLKFLPALRHTYVVPFVPSGLWPRLMSRILTDPKIKALVLEGCAVRPQKEALITWLKWRQGLILQYNSVNILEVEELLGKMFECENCAIKLSKDKQWKQSESMVFGIDIKVYDIYPILIYPEVNKDQSIKHEDIIPDGPDIISPLLENTLSLPPLESAVSDSLAPKLGLNDIDAEFAKLTQNSTSCVSGNLMGANCVSGNLMGANCVSSNLMGANRSRSKSTPASDKGTALLGGPPVSLKETGVVLNEDNFDRLRAGLLSRIVEHIALLLEDWFVGVRPRSLVVPCPFCSLNKLVGPIQLERSFFSRDFASVPTGSSTAMDSGVRYVFEYDDCIVAARSRDYVECPDHGQLPLAYVAPDTLFLTEGKDILINETDIVQEEMLGRGAFATVFKARVKNQHGRGDKAVALKALTKEWQYQERAIDSAEQDGELEPASTQQTPTRHSIVQGFNNLKKELSILCQLKHQHIVDFYGVLLRPLGLVLELASRGSLKHILKEYDSKQMHLAPNVSQAVIKQIASALHYLHSKDIIYRDCKSDNILVWQFPEPHELIPSGVYLDTNTVLVKMSDYGISQFAATQGARGLVGTPGYMAPEILKYQGREVYTNQVDIFSFAMLIYEIITLHQPYDNLTGQQANQSNENGARPSLKRKDLPCPVLLRELMAWCWQQNPDERPTAKQIIDTVETDQFLRLLDGIRVCDYTQVISCCHRIIPPYLQGTSQRYLLGKLITPTPWVSSSFGVQQQITTNTGTPNQWIYQDQLSLPEEIKSKANQTLTQDDVGSKMLDGHDGSKQLLTSQKLPSTLTTVTKEQSKTEGLSGMEGQSKKQDRLTCKDGAHRSVEQEEPSEISNVTEAKQPPSTAYALSEQCRVTETEVRSKTLSNDITSMDGYRGSVSYDSSSPAFDRPYGDEETVCELWVASSDGHRSVATVIDFTGSFVNTEDIDLGDTPVSSICMVKDKVWIGFRIGYLLIYDAGSRHISAQVWIKHHTAINHIIHIPSFKKVYIALENGSVYAYSDTPAELQGKALPTYITLTPEAQYHDNTQTSACLLSVPHPGAEQSKYELWVGQRSLITVLNPNDLTVTHYITMAADPSSVPSYMQYLVYAYLVCSTTSDQATALGSYLRDSESYVNVYGASYHGQYLRRWNGHSKIVMETLDCQQFITSEESRISALHYSDLQLFVGFTNGSILILDVLDFSALCLFHCHHCHTKCLLVLDMQQEQELAYPQKAGISGTSLNTSPFNAALKTSSGSSYTSLQSTTSQHLLLSFGTGFMSYFDAIDQKPFSNSAYLLVWDSEHWRSSRKHK